MKLGRKDSHITHVSNICDHFVPRDTPFTPRVPPSKELYPRDFSFALVYHAISRHMFRNYYAGTRTENYMTNPI